MFRQDLNVTVTGRTAEIEPSVLEALQSVDGFQDVSVVPSAPVKEVGPNRQRLIELAVWVAGENAKQELGLPSEWDQGSWVKRASCGTTCCVAGRVALEDGGVPVPFDEADDLQAALRNFEQAEPGDDWSWVLLPGRDEMVQVDEYAQEALGLTYDQAARLFNGDNSYQAILRVIRELINPEPEPEPEPEPKKVPTVRRLRDSRQGQDCGMGPVCDICYEDVPADAPADAPVPSPF